jgi:hypothetical protein
MKESSKESSVSVQLILYADLDPDPLIQTMADAASATFEALFIQQLAYLNKLLFASLHFTAFSQYRLL